jgi:hypothetical protein
MKNWKEGDQYEDGNNRLGKVSLRGKEEHKKKMRSCGTTDEQAQLEDDPLKVETFYEEEEE